MVQTPVGADSSAGRVVTSNVKSSLMRFSRTRSSFEKWLPIQLPDIRPAGTFIVRSTFGR